ncbi:MAG: hypothetical protein ACKOPM_09155 [Novosphingobium sp.]
MTFWPAVLSLAAAYNLIIGGASLFQPGAAREGRVTGLLVAGFGVVYAITASDPARFAPMLWAGVLGKLGVIALLGPAVRSGALPRGVGWVLAGDAVFTALFLWLLLGGG